MWQLYCEAASTNLCADADGSETDRSGAAQALPSRQILIIEDAEETAIVPITGAESLVKLIANVYSES